MARIALLAPRELAPPQPVASIVRPTPGLKLGTLAGWVTVAFVLVSAWFSMYLTQVSSVATGGYDLQRLQAERAGWQARNEQLELELAKRRSLAWAKAQAAEQLGMTQSANPTFLAVDPHLPGLATASAQARPSDPAVSSPADGVTRREPENLRRYVDALASWLALALAPGP